MGSETKRVYHFCAECGDRLPTLWHEPFCTVHRHARSTPAATVNGAVPACAKCGGLAACWCPTSAADGEADLRRALNRAGTIVRRIVEAAKSKPEQEGGYTLRVTNGTLIELADATYQVEQLALRARPLPDDVRAVVERVESAMARRRGLVAGGVKRDTKCIVASDQVAVSDVAALLAHLQRTEGK